MTFLVEYRTEFIRTELLYLPCVEEPASNRCNDAALFEEVLWQPTAEEADNESDEHIAGETDAEKEPGLLDFCV